MKMSDEKKQNRPGHRLCLPRYSARKAAQAVAFFVLKEGEPLNVLKLMKLLYLAETMYLDEYGSSMLDDKCLYMKYDSDVERDPCKDSKTYNYIKGFYQSVGWNEFIDTSDFIAANFPGGDYTVDVKKRDLAIQDLDELSQAEVEVLEKTYEEFGRDKTGLALAFYIQGCKHPMREMREEEEEKMKEEKPAKPLRWWNKPCFKFCLLICACIGVLGDEIIDDIEVLEVGEGFLLPAEA